MTGAFKQIGADGGRTMFLVDVLFIFVPEIPDRAQNRVGGGLSKAA